MNDGKLYKYWIYYLKGEIYAYTDDKVLAKIFENQRDTDKFEKETRKLNKLEVHDMAENYQCQMLEIYPIEFYDDETKEKYSVSYALTTSEKLEFIHLSTNVELNIYKNTWTNPLIFKKDIQKALFTLNYYKYFINIADTLTPNAKHNLAHDIIDNIRQICEDGGFFAANQEESYFDTYTSMVCNRLPELGEDVEVDQLAILIQCIKETL